ncbi:hypothetical protein BD779DRAFT_1670218 [Infundibulicybe gibba]|nr:hypothetical protein BD779DRAFT_1670218 [Infundibulicybe gibba]
MPLETISGGIAFAPNLTPVTFNDPPPLVDAPPCDSILFPSPDDCSPPRRPGHSKKKPENHIPRPPNAFILFRSSFIKSQHVSTEVETNHSTLSKIIGLTWQNLPNEERQIWHAKAKAALDEHKRKFPQYAFRPLHSKAKGGGTEKRKVREVGPKDMKRCAKIAELLVNGKKGQELDAAIQEFDKHHVPEVVTRFEAPLTANMYRRSSSVPVPDVEAKKPFLSSPSARKLRSTSSQPTLQANMQQSPTPSLEQAQMISPIASEYDSPSFDQFAFSLKQTPSLDLNSFAFDNISPSLPIFPCPPIPTDPVGSFNPMGDMFEDNTSNPPRLSIDTSFLNMDAWSRCSSPLSSMSSIPATPSSYLDSPPIQYSPYRLESFDQSLQKAMEDTSQFPSYECSFTGSEVYCSSPEFGSFDQDHSNNQLPQLAWISQPSTSRNV